jgi:hypothetical protein
MSVKAYATIIIFESVPSTILLVAGWDHLHDGPTLESGVAAELAVAT